MCEPTTIAIGGAVAAAGSLGMNFMGQQAAAGQAAAQVKRDNDYKIRLMNWKNERYLRQAASIQESTTDKTNAMMERVNQMRQAAMVEVEKSARYARGASSTIAVARDEMSGNTVRALQNEAQRLGAETQQVVWSNLEGQIRQANRQVRGIVAQGQSALEQSYPDPMAPLGTAPSGPNPLSLVFGLGSVAASAAGTYMDLSTPTDTAQLPSGPNTEPVTVGGASYPAYGYMPNLSGGGN